MNQVILSEKNLKWLRDHLVLGDNRIFEGMEKTVQRIKQETQKSRENVQ